MRFRDAGLREGIQRKGYVVVDLLDAAEINHLRSLWDTADDPIKCMPFNVTIMSADTAYRQRIDREVAAVVGPKQQALLESSRFCYGSLVSKMPSHDGTVPMHQDPSFIDEEHEDTYNFWIALDDVNEANGCLHVVPGSHTLNRRRRSGGAFFNFPYPDLLPMIRERFMRALPIRAGQAVIHPQTLFHMSYPNRSDRVRLAVSGLAVPAAATLRHYYQPFGQWTAPLEVFEVADDFYTQHRMLERPSLGRHLGTFGYSHEPLDADRVAGVLGEARGE